MHERLFIWNASVRIKPSHSPLLGFLDHHLFSVSVLCVSAPHCFECSVCHLYNRRSSRDSLGGIGKNCHPRWFHGALASIPISVPHTEPSATPPNPSPQVSHFFQGKRRALQLGLMLLSALAGPCHFRAACPLWASRHDGVCPAVTTLVTGAGG